MILVILILTSRKIVAPSAIRSLGIARAAIENLKALNLERAVIGRVLRTIWMAAPMYPLLEAAYDLQHRAHHLADLNENLTPLRARVHSPLRWDERYAEYLQRAGFLDLVVQVVGGLPPMDRPLLTAMVDRWCPETHTFHLPFGEMTITMQDVAMLLGLPLDGQPVTGIIQNKNWRDMVEMHIGIRPSEPEGGDSSKKTSGVSSAWLREHFDVCPPGANDEVVQRYARVWLWHFVSTFLFPDAAGNTVSWMVLPILGFETTKG
ncbi:protein MAIN-LIKE 2-like isoform X3 [Setaria viridis]|uniref:protein MAIN-LIKE 2-like isoform X3 n=1 Tax=Setaria viridis TaxID=4556 RepID=UPI001493963F|nr:protein MAIN-LIKE 2-like isoform X2 [Setaria viridis]XP_034603434.1 protein MAIN-LIKE 2-like isoform X2 [Setaria viridis]